MLAILFGLIPVELGILGFIARKEKTTIKKLIRFTESMSVKRTLLWAIPCMIIALQAELVLPARVSISQCPIFSRSFASFGRCVILLLIEILSRVSIDPFFRLGLPRPRRKS